MMRPRAAMALACVVAGAAWSQGGSSPTDMYSDERARIAALKVQRAAELDAQERQCDQRFAVTDCVNQVRSQRRQVMSGLEQQLVKINDAQRQQQAEEVRRARLEKEHERTRRQSPNTTRPPDTVQSNKKTQARAQALPPRLVEPKTTADPAVLDRRRADFQEKQAAAERRRQERTRRLQEKKSVDQPLPVAP